jgi:hypothetical protein
MRGGSHHPPGSVSFKHFIFGLSATVMREGCASLTFYIFVCDHL